MSGKILSTPVEKGWKTVHAIACCLCRKPLEFPFPCKTTKVCEDCWVGVKMYRHGEIGPSYRVREIGGDGAENGSAVDNVIKAYEDER